MDKDRFADLLDELEASSLDTLKQKSSKYSEGYDILHNFEVGSELTGESMAKTCWGYLTKHLVSLRDMILRNDFYDRDDFLEKCQDSINYIRFLWCIGNDNDNEERY